MAASSVDSFGLSPRALWLLAALLPVAALADDELRQACNWLERMNKSIASLEYDGHFVYQQGNSLEAMQIRHEITHQGPREYLLSLNGKAKEVIRDDQAILVLENSGDHVQVRKRAALIRVSPVPASILTELDQHYHILMGEQVRVAGHTGQVIALKPRDEFRYGYRLTLDQDSALPLDMAVLNANGDPVSRIMYTNLEISANNASEDADHARLRPLLAAAASQVEVDGADAQAQEANDDSSKSRWFFQMLPPGFSLKTYRLKWRAQDQLQLEHFIFSDGLATLSVYVEQIGVEPALNGSTSQGPLNASGRQIDGHQLTAVGEVPHAALDRVLGGATLKKD